MISANNVIRIAVFFTLIGGIFIYSEKETNLFGGVMFIIFEIWATKLNLLPESWNL